MKTWKLSSFDTFTLGMIIKSAWVYEQVPDINKMKESLSELIKTYPYLSGKFEAKTKSVVWMDYSVPEIPFELVDQPLYSVSELCGNPNLAWSLVKQFNINDFKAGKMKAFTATLLRLNDSAVLYVQAAHALMDAATFYSIIRQWAELYKGNDITPMTIDQSLLPSPDAFDEKEALAKVQEQGWMKMTSKKLIKMLWNLMKNNSIKDTVSIEVPQEQILALRNITGAGTNAVLTAIAAQKFYERLPKHKSFKLITVMDLRGRFTGIDGSFMGNFSQAMPVSAAMATAYPAVTDAASAAIGPATEAGTGPEVAVSPAAGTGTGAAAPAQVRDIAAATGFSLSQSTESLIKEIDRATKAFIGSGIAEQITRLSICASEHSLPYFFFDASDMNCGDPGTLYTNNQLKFRACELDWGIGMPRWCYPNTLTDMVKFWQPVAGGPVQIIYGGQAAKIMKGY